MKKYIIKSIFVCLLGALFFGQTACSDLLNQEPQGTWVVGDNKDGSYTTDVFTLYAKLRGFSVTSGNGALAIHNYRCEDIEKGSIPGDGADAAAMYDDFGYNASNGMIASYWTGNYEMIHIVNRLLADMEDDIADGYEVTEGDLINQAEARFVRAFAYFNLVRAFGEVPLIDFKINDAAEANVPKSTSSKIYELIDADLTFASEHLPLRWENRFIGRLTRGAARSLHAKTYMMRNDWNNMLTAATEVINSGVYNLSTPFSTIFREEGENCPESIWELQCTATASIPASNDIGSQYAQVQGVRGAGDWNWGWGMHTPTTILADAFEPGDPRKDETLLYFARTGEDPSLVTPNQPYNEVPIAAADVMNSYYNKKVYTNPSLRNTYTKGGYWMNIRMIRYSEILLIAAEAANELGDGATARNYLEQVRGRARGNNANVLPEVTTNVQSELRDAIRHERRVELAMEWDRFYDLVRWGTARQVLHAAGKTAYQDRHALLPIPQAEVDKSNGVLKQNPNY